MKLGTKIFLGFSALVVVVLLLGMTGYYSASRSGAQVEDLATVRLPGVQSLLTIGQVAERVKTIQRTLLDMAQDEQTRNRQAQHLANARAVGASAFEKYGAVSHTPETEAIWKDLTANWQAWKDANDQFFKAMDQIDELKMGNLGNLDAAIEGYMKDHYKRCTDVMVMAETGQDFEGGEDHTQCAYGKWAAANTIANPAVVAAIRDGAQPHEAFHAAIRKIKLLAREGKLQEAQAAIQAELLPQQKAVISCMAQINDQAESAIGMAEQARAIALGPCLAAETKVHGILERLMEIETKTSDEVAAASQSQARFSKTLSLASTIGGLVLGVLLAIFITRSITRPIQRIIAELTAGAEQTSAASSQVSAASQSLAQGSSEQAASLEETSSSLEEMSSMTKRNAESAGEAASLSGEARRAADHGNQAMARMSTAIREIQSGASETAKILKAIDEIAFQTNLLALNAAVEAARAGEAGKGFAVVAEEVRNLAMRSAEAAKNTAELIDRSINNANGGVKIADEVQKALEEITGSSTKVDALLGEIAAASQEQSRGIEQVTTAVTQMDKVTQQNAANAEESAAASEELAAQAESLSAAVRQLTAMVQGSVTSGASVEATRLAKSDAREFNRTYTSMRKAA